MPSQWADLLAPSGESSVRETFKALLAERIEEDFEAEEELVNCVLEALVLVNDKQDLIRELTEVFEDSTVPISDWCWDTLGQFASQKQNEPSQPLTPVSSPQKGQPAEQEQEEEQAPQRKRAPICFNLEGSAPETAPKKASDGKAQELGFRKEAAPEQPPKQAPAPKQPPTAGPMPAQQPVKADEQPARAGSGRQRGAPGSARLLHMTGLIRPADGSSGGRESRARGRQQENQREQQPGDSGRPGDSRRPGDSSRPDDTRRPEDTRRPGDGSRPGDSSRLGDSSRPEDSSRSPQQQRKRPLEDPRGGESRTAPGAAPRRGPASAVVGPGSMFRSAVDGLKTDKGSSGSGSRAQAGAEAPPQQQQQQQAGAGSVFSRIARDDLARIGVAQPQLQPAGVGQMADAQQSRQPQQQQQGRSEQQQRQLGVIDGLPRSLQGRLGIMGSRPSPAQAAQQPSTQAKAPAGAAGAAAAATASAVGAKRKAAEPSTIPAGAAAASAAPPAAAAPKGPLHSSAAPGQQQQEPQAGAAAKKSRTAAAPAAPAAAAAAASGGKALSSKEAEIAALRAQLEARQAEVKRLKQAQEADQVSVAVFGVSPRVPDTVLMAHFRSCADTCGANIKRCTLLAGRYQPHVTMPGAYLEFEGMGGDPALRAEAAQKATANALQLSGSMLLDQKITVLRKSEWQASQAKGQRIYTAARSGAAAAGGAPNRTWKGPGAPAGPAAAAAGSAPAAAGS